MLRAFGRIERAVFDQPPRRDEHAARVHADVAHQALELLAGSSSSAPRPRSSPRGKQRLGLRASASVKLEGLVRNVGMHAGGVLIAPGRLVEYCPLYAAEGTQHVISQLDKDDVEAIGLVKFDFLGLTTLTVLDLASAPCAPWGIRTLRSAVAPRRCRDLSAALRREHTAVFSWNRAHA